MVIKINYRLTAAAALSLIAVCVFIPTVFKASDPPGRMTVPLPVIMYHHISEDPAALNAYVISPSELEEDIKLLKDTGFCFVLPKDVYAYASGGAPLPEKPVLITFDDGFESVLKYAFPLCEKYGLRFTAAVIGSQTDLFSGTDDHNILYSYLTWSEIKELNDSGFVEIANHTYGLHSDKKRKGIKRIKGESLEAYEKEISSDILKLQDKLKEKAGVFPEVFVYPYGFICEESFAIIKKLGFKISFSCYEGINQIERDPDRLFQLKRFNRPHGMTSRELADKLKQP